MSHICFLNVETVTGETVTVGAVSAAGAVIQR